MKTKIIPWVIAWGGIVTKIHKYYLKELGINPNIEAYMRSLVIRKTLESISLDHRRNIKEDNCNIEADKLVNKLAASISEDKS